MLYGRVSLMSLLSLAVVHSSGQVTTINNDEISFWTGANCDGQESIMDKSRGHIQEIAAPGGKPLSDTSKIQFRSVQIGTKHTDDIEKFFDKNTCAFSWRYVDQAPDHGQFQFYPNTVGISKSMVYADGSKSGHGHCFNLNGDNANNSPYWLAEGAPFACYNNIQELIDDKKPLSTDGMPPDSRN